jgi:hypothetical protein
MEEGQWKGSMHGGRTCPTLPVEERKGGGRERGEEGREERVEGREGARGGRGGGQVRNTCNGSPPGFAQAQGLGAQAWSRAQAAAGRGEQG